jgi:anaerobic selenocysteine-containing dehydrogenase
MNGTKSATDAGIETAAVAPSEILAARASKHAGYGWACLNPETANRLGLKCGDTVWLSHEEAAAPFNVESMEEVDPRHAWLNSREMVAMGVGDGSRLRASGSYFLKSPQHHAPEAGQAGRLEAQSDRFFEKRKA